MRKIWIYPLLLIAAAGVPAAWSGLRPPSTGAAVARVAGVEITAEAFRASYAEYLLKSGVQDAMPLRQAHLDYLIGRELVARAMREGGIERDARYRHEMETAKLALLIGAYSEAVLFEGTEASEADLREMFVRANTKLKARHLYARTEEQANVLYDRLQAGEPFEKLAEEVFADPELARNGGSVGYFGFDDMDPAFEDAAYGLKVGETSAPVRTAQGYSIIQLEDRRVEVALTESEFAKKRGQLRQYALRRKRSEAVFRHSEELERALAVSFQWETLERLFHQTQGAALTPSGEEGAAWMKAPLVAFTSGGRRQTWSVAAFRERARYTSEEQRARINSVEDMQAFVKGLVIREEMLGRARAMGLDRTASFTEKLEREKEDWMYRAAHARIEAGLEIPEDSLRAFYGQAKDLLTVPEKVSVKEILVDTKAEADRVKAQLRSRPFEVLAREFSLRLGAADNGGDLGYLTREQMGLVADAVFGASPGSVVGPLEAAGHYVLLKVGERQAARPMTYEEALPKVTLNVKGGLLKAAFARHIAELRSRYDVMVDLEALAAVDAGI